MWSPAILCRGLLRSSAPLLRGRWLRRTLSILRRRFLRLCRLALSGWRLRLALLRGGTLLRSLFLLRGGLLALLRCFTGPARTVGFVLILRVLLNRRLCNDQLAGES